MQCAVHPGDTRDRLKTRALFDDPDRTPGTMHSPYGSGRFPGSGVFWVQGPLCLLGIDPAFDDYTGLKWDSLEQNYFQGPALSLYHGNAALPHTQQSYHRLIDLAALAV